MDRRFLTVLGVSLVFALVVSSVFYQMTARSSGPRKAEPTDMKDVVVATRPLGIGVMIKPADVKLVRVSPDGFPKGAFTKVEEVLDRPVVSNILLDEPLLEGRLAVKGSGMGLAPTIPVGMRAVTVRVNDVAGAAGFVLPGLKVDVLVTGHPPTGDGNMTSTVLQNVLVLSAGQAMQADARGTPVSVTTVTLLATPADAETLTLANGEGRLQLILRNSSDEGVEKTAGRYVSELYGAPRRVTTPAPTAKPAAPKARPVVMVAAPLVVPVAPAPPPPPDQIVVFRGDKRTVEIIPRGN
jgi:pilus assembly protein CpaB